MSDVAGVSIQAFTAAEFVRQVQQAERLGIGTAWTTIGGAGGADPLRGAGSARQSKNLFRKSAAPGAAAGA